MRNILLILSIAFSITATSASEQYFVSVDDFIDTEFEAMFEIKSAEHEKVILDCQSFFAGINIYNQSGILYNQTMDHGQCYELTSFIKTSMQQNRPVCIEIDSKGNSLIVSRKEKDCQAFAP
jgi:hypothetical protein